MLEEKRKIGQKGQVVIPQAIRKALAMPPGTNVIVSLEDNKVVLRKVSFDAVAVFRKTAKQINYNKEIDPHEAYEESIQRRTSGKAPDLTDDELEQMGSSVFKGQKIAKLVAKGRH